MARITSHGRAIAAASVVIVGALASLGCKEEKMGVEKRAEEMAASASAAKSAAASAAPDPAELQYKARKALLDKTVLEMRADEGLYMAKDPKAPNGTLRKYFEAGDVGLKPFKDLETRRRKEGDDGYRISKSKVDSRLAGNMEEAEVDVTIETLARGNTGCVLLVEKWKWRVDKWVWSEQKSGQKVDCTP